MSDRTAQEIFDTLFKVCAKEDEAGKRIARTMWRAMEGYDLSRFELDPKPLVELGLARHVVVEEEESEEEESEGYDFRSFNLKSWDDGY